MATSIARRQFIFAVGGAALAWPFDARAQQPNNPVIGYFSGRSSDSEELYRAAFRQGLQDAGFVEGHNVRIEYRFSNGQDDQLPAIAADFVRQQVTMLVATDGPSALAAKGASTTIPIVFSAGGDPIKLGLVIASTGQAATPPAYTYSSPNWGRNACS